MKARTLPRWSTSSFGDAAAPSAHDTSSLGEHLTLCHGLRGRLFGLRCGAEAVHGFVAARFVTTTVVVAVLVGAGLMVMAP